MAVRHYRLDYNINGGPWIQVVADEAPGPDKTLSVNGLSPGTYALKLRMVPLSGDTTPIESAEAILQVGNPGISEPVFTVAESVVTLAEVIVRRDALLAAAGVAVSSADAQSMNEALLAAAGVDATVADNLGIQASDTLTIASTVTATISSVQNMLEQVQVAITSAATVSDSLQVAADSTAPTVTTFTVGTPSGSTVPITSFTATDAVGVTGYLITESATPPAPGAAGWSGTAPTSYTAVGTGSLTLYAWAKDAAGNVSAAATAAVTITITALSSVTETFTNTFGPLTSTPISIAENTMWAITDGLFNYTYNRDTLVYDTSPASLRADITYDDLGMWTEGAFAGVFSNHSASIGTFRVKFKFRIMGSGNETILKCSATPAGGTKTLLMTDYDTTDNTFRDSGWLTVPGTTLATSIELLFEIQGGTNVGETIHIDSVDVEKV